MIEQINVVRIRGGTLFQIYFLGLTLTLYPIALIAGMAAAFGANTVQSGGVQLHGWKAALDAVVAPPIFAALCAALLLVFTWPGLWIFSKFQRLSLSFYSLTPPGLPWPLEQAPVEVSHAD